MGSRPGWWNFAHLIGTQHDDGTGRTTFSLSNRQKPVTIAYGPKLAGWFDFRLELALARYQNTVLDLVAQLRADLAAVDARRPLDPETARGR